MVKLIPRLVRANLTLGIDEENGHVGELTVEQVVLAATTAFDRAVQVCVYLSHTLHTACLLIFMSEVVSEMKTSLLHLQLPYPSHCHTVIPLPSSGRASDLATLHGILYETSEGTCRQPHSVNSLAALPKCHAALQGIDTSQCGSSK
jgi:hypothetical protein